MDYNTFQRITRKGNFVAWKQTYGNEELTAIAYMAENAWFNIAINCMRDGDMGKKDTDGVYDRHWSTDEVWIEDEPRVATEREILLYLIKVGGLVACGATDKDNNPLPFVGNRCDINYNANKKEKYSGWVNIYYEKGTAKAEMYHEIYATEEIARHQGQFYDWIATVKIEWEE